MFTNRSIRTAVVGLGLTIACTVVNGGDSLLSRGSLVERTEPNPPTAVAPDTPAASEPAEQAFDEARLDAALRAAGFVPTVADGDRTIEITMAAETAGLQIDLVGDRLAFVLPLGTIPSERLRDVLQANGRVAPASFVLNASEQRLELRMSVRHVGLTPELLKAEIDHLANVATETASVWKSTGQQPEAPASAEKRTLNLVGRWVVDLPQGGGFVLRLEQTRSFVLGHRKPDGVIDRSEGTFDLRDGQLVLKHADGSQLAGAIEAVDENSFRYSIGSGDGLVFERK